MDARRRPCLAGFEFLAALFNGVAALGMIALFQSPEVKFYLGGNLVLQRLVELTLFGIGAGFREGKKRGEGRGERGDVMLLFVSQRNGSLMTIRTRGCAGFTCPGRCPFAKGVFTHRSSSSNMPVSSPPATL